MPFLVSRFRPVNIASFGIAINHFQIFIMPSKARFEIQRRSISRNKQSLGESAPRIYLAELALPAVADSAVRSDILSTTTTRPRAFSVTSLVHLARHCRPKQIQTWDNHPARPGAPRDAWRLSYVRDAASHVGSILMCPEPERETFTNRFGSASTFLRPKSNISPSSYQPLSPLIFCGSWSLRSLPSV